MAKNRCQTREKRTEPSQRMSFIARHPHMTTDCRCDVDQVKRIDVLPDDVLIEIFDFYVEIGAWQSLVHVCRRWRSLVFGSPRRLNLRLHWTYQTKDKLDVWPALPLTVRVNTISKWTIAALEQSNRVCEVSLFQISYWKLEDVLAAMQVSFPELTVLRLAAGSRYEIFKYYHTHHLLFPIRSWMDLPHIFDTSNCMAFHFRDCQDCFCLLLTLSNLTSPISLILGTYHLKRWSFSSPCCPTSEHFALISNPLNLALKLGKAEVSLH
jgi:hypothetical protein